MDTLKKIWPRAFKKYDSVADLIVGILIYIVLAIVAGIVIGLAAAIIGPISGLLAGAIGVIGTLVDVYTLIGIVLAILNYCNVLK